MPDDQRDKDRQRAYDRLTDEEKFARLAKILSTASSDPRGWDDQTAGAAQLTADFAFDHGDYLLASTNSGTFLTFLIDRHGAGDEEYVLPWAYNAGFCHYRLEDSLGVIAVTQPVFDYWVNERVPPVSSQRILGKMVRLYTMSARPQEAYRLNSRLLRASLRHRRFIRLIRRIAVQADLRLRLWGVAGRPELEGAMRRRKRT